MEEILLRLPATARVLDLASATGSYDPRIYEARTLRLDRGSHSGIAPLIRGDAAKLPFAAASFDAVIANHCFEHFRDVDAVLAEIRRILRPSGSLFVAVPDAATFTDRLYRVLHKNDHVQRFRSAPELAARIAAATGLPHVATRDLYSSLSYLNAHNWKGPAPRRLRIFGNGDERVIRWLLRFGGRRYGWGFWFGETDPVDETARANVCVRCGCGHPESELTVHDGVYNCTRCGAENDFYSIV